MAIGNIGVLKPWNEDSSVAPPEEEEPPPPEEDTYESLILANEPVAYWRMLDMTDSSGNGFDLTDVGGTTNATSIITDAEDGAQSLDSSGDASMEVADDPLLRLGSGDYSVEFWITPSFIGAFNIISKDQDFRVTIAGSKVRFSPNGAGDWWTEVDTSTTLTVGAAHHIVFTWNGTTKIMKSYCDGVFEDDTDASTFGYAPSSSGWGSLRIGKNADTVGGVPGTVGYQGVIDEVAIYQSELSAVDIEAHYEMGLSGGA